MRNWKEKFLNLEEIESLVLDCYAHRKEEGGGEKRETLLEHTALSQKYFLMLMEKKELYDVFERFQERYLETEEQQVTFIYEEMAANVVTFHDVGKINPLYQWKKMAHVWKKELQPGGNVGSKHSLISATIYMDYFLKRIMVVEDAKIRKHLKDLVYVHSFLIARHHSAMEKFRDYLISYEYEDDGEPAGVGADVVEWLKMWRLNTTDEEGKLSIRKKLKTSELPSEKQVILYAYTRLLYSLLTAADYYATSEFMNGTEIQNFGNECDWNEIYDVYEKTEVQQSIRKYEKECYPMDQKELQKQKINPLRTELFLEAERVLEEKKENAVFYLEAPTGSGKSNTAMNLSLKLVRECPKINKIFYIYPFNTLVEQNMSSMETVFEGREDILSKVAVVNSLVKMKDDEENYGEEEKKNYEKILLDRQFLNYPIVLSTHVSLFRTLFGKQKQDLFGFHQICNSVIVLDEIQSYNIRIWGEIIHFLKGYAQLLNIKIIIMSATLPNLEVLTENKEDAVPLILDRKKYFEHPIFRNRVQADYSLLKRNLSLEELAEHVSENQDGSRNILIEFISKVHAYEFFEILSVAEEVEILLMTGDTSIQERKQIIQKVKKEQGVILVATQVVEAGVDIDMDIGYKDCSKLDSEEQFMGRINRSGKEKGTVYFFELDDARAIYHDDLRTDAQLTLQNEEMQEVLSSKDFNLYYGKILDAIRMRGKKENEDNLEKFFRDEVGGLNFPKVEKRMELIPDNNNLVSVFLARIIEEENGEILDGRAVWQEYVKLLQNEEMDYAEKTVKLFEIRTRMNHFLYQVNKWKEFYSDDRIGDIFYIEQGEEYFENGVFQRNRFENQFGLFL